MCRRTGNAVNPYHIVSLEYTSWPIYESKEQSIKRQGRWKHFFSGQELRGYRVRIEANLTDGGYAVLESSLEPTNEVPQWMTERRAELEQEITAFIKAES